MRTPHGLALGFLVASALALPARLLTGANVWTIPGTVNVSGLNDTRYVSDLAVTNPGTVPAQLTISLVPANGTAPKQATLNAGETLVYRNLLDGLWGAQGSGATQVSSDASLLIRARTYNTAASGTYGVALPAFADDRLLSRGNTADSLWISQSADGSSGYRTNLNVVFPDAGGGAATVTVYDGNGNKIGSKDFSLDAAGVHQVGVGDFAGAVPVGRAKIQVTRGRAAGYSVVVDNVTGDGSLFTFEDLPEGYQDVLVNGVARLNGKNNTFYRTDGRFYNPATTDAKVTVAFHANQGSNPSPVTRDLIVPAGKILDVVDVLDSLLALPVGSAGALRFSSASPVAILCRTSNIDPSGAKPGTFGAQQEPTPLLAFLMSADPGAVVTGIRQNAAFRTNVGFAAGKDGASYALTLKSRTGGTVATATASLGTFGWTQPSVESLFPGTTIPDDATLLVKVASGSVDVFDSSVDNASGDSVVTPIMPLPVDIPPAATIGPLGGSIRSDDGRLTLKVPAGALSSGIALSFVKTDNGAPQGQGSAYNLSPGGLSFAMPAQLVFGYGRGDVAGGGPGSLGLAFTSGGQWYVSTGGAVNPSRHTLTVPITSTTPPTSPPAGRAAGALDVPFDQQWAPFLAREMFPRLKAIPEGGTVQFGIFVLSHSSTDHSSLEAFLLGSPVNPMDLQYHWFVDGTINGSDAVGTIKDLQNIAIYTAPRCVPSDNPVTVLVSIYNPGGSTFLGDVVNNFLQATVKILPRNWSIAADFFQYENCGQGNLVARREDWKDVGLQFSLDDKLNIVVFSNPLFYPPVQGKATAFVACSGGNNCDFVEDPLDPIQLTNMSGSYYYDGEKDSMNALVTIGKKGEVRFFAGFMYSLCEHCSGNCRFHYSAYGSPLAPLFGLWGAVSEYFTFDYEFSYLTAPVGVGINAHIFGLSCQ